VLTAKRIGKPSMAAIADAAHDRAHWELGAAKQSRSNVQPRGAKLFSEGELAVLGEGPLEHTARGADSPGHLG
jgi:hypothetical protein